LSYGRNCFKAQVSWQLQPTTISGLETR